MPGQRYLLDGQAHRLADGEQAPAGAVPDLSDATTEACLRLMVLRRSVARGEWHLGPTDLAGPVSALNWEATMEVRLPSDALVGKAP
jgi:hypothetical protein